MVHTRRGNPGTLHLGGSMLKQLTLGLFALATVVCILSIKPARADELTARIRGVASDPSGAVIPGVQVSATNVGTGVSRATKTGNDGSFEILQLLAPGDY